MKEICFIALIMDLFILLLCHRKQFYFGTACPSILGFKKTWLVLIGTLTRVIVFCHISPSNNIFRKKTPWVFAAWHRPWYCSNTKHEDSAESMRQSYEDLFHKYNVNPLF